MAKTRAVLKDAATILGGGALLGGMALVATDVLARALGLY